MQAYDPWDPALRRDPYPTYRHLRETERVAFNARAGLWFVSGYDECSAALRDPRLSARLGQELRRRDGGLPASMLSADGAEHARLRRPVQHMFTTESLRRLQPRIQTIVDRLLDDLAGHQEFDALADFACPLSAMVLADLVGVPGRDFGRFQAWAEVASSNLDPLISVDVQAAATVAADELAAYLGDLLGQRRASPGPGLVGALARSPAVERALDIEELVAFVSLIVIGGYEPVANLLGNGLLSLLTDRRQWGRLCAQPDLVPSCVEELLRFDAPIQLVARVATAEFAIGNVVVREGEGVVGLLGAANRDPRTFADPDRLVPDRRPNPHLALGAGAHFCLGAPLARLVGRLALGAVVARVPDLELGPAEATWRESLVPRGLRTLPVRRSGQGSPP